ncbi:MAG: YgjV family protein [Erysipelotrichaceae bacterium]|nr:YgjV family protein [Erysipelotrichaceae bacterium]
MNEVLLANILTIIGETALFIASTRKNKKDILIFQIVCMFLTSIASYLLKGYSGIVMGVLGIIRNILSIKNIGSRMLSYIFIGSAIVFGCYFNNNGFLGYLAILANVSQSLFILNRKATTRQIRLACAFSSMCWCIYNFAIKGYAGAAFNITNASSYLYNAIRQPEKEKKEEK